MLTNKLKISQSTATVNVLLVGGSGEWSERNHIPALIELKVKQAIKVVAICDPQNPYLITQHHCLQQLLTEDQPSWIDPANMSNTTLLKVLNALNSQLGIDVVIIATDPVFHQFYVEWAVEKQINVACDKPLIVFKNAASVLGAAQKIEPAFQAIAENIRINQLINPSYNLITPLRRRALLPCIKIAEGLQEVYTLTGEGIRFLDIYVSGGIHRNVEEFLGGGAHGYLNGVGSLSHSAYHYIDLIAWYLQIAPSDAVCCKIDLRYVDRVKDYLRTNSYKNLQRIIGSAGNDTVASALPGAVLNAEMNFGFDLHLLNSEDARVGLVSFSFNHTTFTTRTRKFSSGSPDPANHPDGGRMSQFNITLHQGALQSFTLSKNDPVHAAYTIEYNRNCHPRLPFKNETITYEDAHNDTTTPKDLLADFVANKKVDNQYIPYVATIENQRFTHRLFAKFYELIAANASKTGLKDQVSPFVNIY